MPRCKNCKEKFEPRFNTMEKYCWNHDCKIIEAMNAYESNKMKQQKDWNKKKAQIKKSLLTKSDYMKLAQQVFNAWIRMRDQNELCISCNKPPLKKNAGHYFSSGGHSNVRFNEDNVHLQCEHCNTYLSGNLLNYQIGIEKRIGGERLMQLYELAHIEKKWTIDELQNIIKEYKSRIKNGKNYT